MNTTINGIQRGYLHQNFRLFHIKDQISREFEYHYHNFNKIIIFLSGNVTYIVEGKAYFLKPWDILLVNNHDVHKPIIDSGSVYERIIIWIQPALLKEAENENRKDDISFCFQKASERSFNLVRLEPELQNHMHYLIGELENSLQSEDFGAELLSNSLFTEFMVYLNRIFLGSTYKETKKNLQYDKQIEEVLKYINLNLAEDLSIATLSAKFFMNKYYFMHKFKKETGYTIHQYILQKRLLYADSLIQRGDPVIKSGLTSGFSDYSAFLRAYKKMFHRTPSK